MRIKGKRKKCVSRGGTRGGRPGAAGRGEGTRRPGAGRGRLRGRVTHRPRGTSRLKQWHSLSLIIVIAKCNG